MTEYKGMSEETVLKLKRQIEMLRKQILQVSNDLEYEYLLHQIRDLQSIVQKNSGNK